LKNAVSATQGDVKVNCEIQECMREIYVCPEVRLHTFLPAGGRHSDMSVRPCTREPHGNTMHRRYQEIRVAIFVDQKKNKLIN
jgi:hypothetical protein